MGTGCGAGCCVGGSVSCVSVVVMAEVLVCFVCGATSQCSISAVVVVFGSVAVDAGIIFFSWFVVMGTSCGFGCCGGGGRVSCVSFAFMAKVLVGFVCAPASTTS